MSEWPDRTSGLLLFLMIIVVALVLVGTILDTDSKVQDLQRRVGQLESERR